MFGELFRWIAFLPVYLLNCHFHLHLGFFDFHLLIAVAYISSYQEGISACQRMVHSHKPDFPLAYLNQADDVGGMRRNYIGKPHFALPLSLLLSGKVCPFARWFTHYTSMPVAYTSQKGLIPTTPIFMKIWKTWWSDLREGSAQCCRWQIEEDYCSECCPPNGSWETSRRNRWEVGAVL